MSDENRDPGQRPPPRHNPARPPPRNLPDRRRKTDPKPSSSATSNPVAPQPSFVAHDSVKREIGEYIQQLQSMILAVEKVDSVVLSAEDCAALSIACENLQLTDEGQYAKPVEPCFFELSSLNAHHYRMHTNVEGEESSDEHYNSLGKSIQLFTSGQFPVHESGTELCYLMDWEFCSYPRFGTNKDALPLNNITQWCQSWSIEDDAAFHPFFWNPLYFSKKWRLVTTYVPTAMHIAEGAAKSTGEHPHLMFSLDHQILKEEGLLRGEVMAILAATITRLEHFYPKHLYIPVLVLSFMGNLSGRILQAYFDGTKLIVRKTKLLEFTDEKTARKNIHIFLQHMSNVPVGNTRSKANQPGEKDSPNNPSPLAARSSNTPQTSTGWAAREATG